MASQNGSFHGISWCHCSEWQHNFIPLYLSLSHKSIKQMGKMQWENQHSRRLRRCKTDGACLAIQHLPTGRWMSACLCLHPLARERSCGMHCSGFSNTHTHMFCSMLKWARTRSKICAHHHRLSPGCTQVSANCFAYRGLISARHCFILAVVLTLEILEAWKRLKLHRYAWYLSSCCWYTGKYWQIVTEKDASASL